MSKMEKYIGAKIIEGEAMDKHTFEKTHKGQTDEDLQSKANPSGYHVLYPDGYHSWSPTSVFENAYRRITDGELTLLTETKEE